jgi:uncharacterized protein DUF6069
MTEITATVVPAPSTARDRRIRRATAVVGTTAVIAVLWAIGAGLGVDYVLSDSMGSAVISLPVAVIATGMFALLGWGSLALLERFTRRGMAIWTVLAVAVALLSVVPVFLEEATAGTQAALTVLHLAVAAVLIPLFRHTGR